jgi:hypothetical protein
MSDPKPHDIAEIESLLANRQQLVEWLERLDAAGSRAPESVRAKVRSDYEGRLGQVVAQLSTHREVIAETLDGLRSQSKEIQQLRQEETDIRAEAELRHTVGEYSDDEWQLVELESSGKIAGFDHELDRLSAEIRRLEEVQALIVPPAREARRETAPEPKASSAPVLTLEPPSPHARTEEEEVLPQPAPRPEAPRFVPRGGHFPRETLIPSRGAPRTAAPAPAPAPAPGPAPVPAATITTGTRDDELAFLRSMNVEIMTPSPRTPPAPTSGTAAPEAKGPVPVPKTLKCGDCGSLNRPTDWYCERCGAELAAV